MIFPGARDHWQTADCVHVGGPVPGSGESVAQAQETSRIAPLKLRKLLNFADS